MEEALRIALAKIGNGEPNIRFVTSDDKLDEMAVVNTNRSGKSRYPDLTASPRNRLVYVSVSFFHSAYTNVTGIHFIRKYSPS